MKNVIAKVNAKGATLFYRDGKRVSQANLTAAYVAEAQAVLTAGGVDVAKSGGEFLVEVIMLHRVAIEGSQYTATTEAVFTVNVDTVTAGLHVVKVARKLDGFVIARVYDAEEYADRTYDRWGMTRGAICINIDGDAWITKNYGRVFDGLIDELGNAGFTPVTDCQKARADYDEAKEQYNQAFKRYSEQQGILHAACEHCRIAVVEKVKSLTT